MSIELKQAAQDAAEAIDWLLKNIRLDAPHLAGKAMGNAERCASALRTAIQQAGAKTDVRCEGCGYMTHHREHMGCVRAAKQFTHPAPGVPDGFALVPLKATPKVAMVLYEGARNCFSPKVAEGLWQDALTAAQAQKGQP